MNDPAKEFQKVVKFHGHACPGLAFGFRVTRLALRELGIDRAADEELVAVVENNSCAVDAIQAMAGCTFGKGNLIFNDYGKQVYTFIRRSSGQAVRLAVHWQPSPESPEVEEAWEKFLAGERAPEVMKLVKARKATKMKEILDADDRELFKISRPEISMPAPATIYQSLTCQKCGEKVMESRIVEGLCIACAEED